MLETIREYGLEQLVAHGETKTARRRHATWFVDLVRRLAPDRHEAYRASAHAELAADHDNLRAALAFLEESEEAETILSLAPALYWFWFVRGHLSEGRERLERALAAAPEVPAAVRASALVQAGALAHWQGDEPRAVVLLDQSVAIGRGLGNDRDLGVPLLIRGIVAEDQGDYDRAAAYCDEALALFRRCDQPFWIALALQHLGVVAYGRGDAARATPLLEEALALFRRIEDDYGTSVTLDYLGLVACETGDQAQAAACYAESLVLHARIGVKEHVARSLAGVATLAVARGEMEPAARLFGAAATVRDASGIALQQPERAAFERAIAGVRDGLDEAALTAATAAGRALPQADAVAEAAKLMARPAQPAIASRPTPPAPAAAAGLTPRELDVLRLIVACHTDRQIAEALYISHRTAQGHVAAIFAKLGVNSRTAAATAAIAAGLAGADAATT
jgi:non-specific serine/threonine protein kinase